MEECPVCGDTKNLKPDPASAWCYTCTELTLIEQDVLANAVEDHEYFG